jgi:hypothetical protein
MYNTQVRNKEKILALMGCSVQIERKLFIQSYINSVKAGSLLEKEEPNQNAEC